jgi:hypothetical protein
MNFYETVKQTYTSSIRTNAPAAGLSGRWEMHWYKLLAYFPDERGNKRKFYCNALFIERALKKRAIEIKRGGGDLRYFEHIFEPLGSFIRSSEFDYILTPPGTEDTSFAQKIAERLSRESGVPYINYFEPHRHKRRVIREKFNKINLVCGRYEGFDQRILDLHSNYEIAVGHSVVSGGEVPAMFLMESLIRKIHGVLGNPDSLNSETFTDDKVDYPVYTRPEKFKGKLVPEVLLSGNHKEIDLWKKKNLKDI